MTDPPPSELDPADLESAARSLARPAPELPGLPAICPFLAGGDGSWRSVEPAKTHVCAAVHPPAVLAGAKQRQLCLGVAHSECATYKAARALLPVAGPTAYDAGLWPTSQVRVTTLEPVRSGVAGGITTPQARAGGQALLVGLIVVAFALLVATRSAPGGTAGPAGGSPAPTVAGGAGAGTSPSPAVTTAPSVISASPSASASPAATATPVASLAGATYTVKRGDTLSGIALKFGVTLRALRKANGLPKDAVIRRGQVLVIPAPQATTAP